MPSTSEILLQYVCPAAGVVTANLMWMAPVQDVRKATREGRLGDLNPTPWGVMLGNCTGWVIYSFLIHNVFVLLGNSFGLILSVWLNLQAIKLQYGDFRSTEVRRSIVSALEEESQRSFVVPRSKPAAASGPESTHEGDSNDDEETQREQALSSVLDFAKIVWNVTAQNQQAPVAHERIVTFMVILWLAVICVIAYGSDVIPLDSRQLIVGIIVNLNLIFFYGAPLSTIFTVLRSKSTATIHIPTMITNTLNGVFWSAFGIATADWFIGIPNGLGALLGGIQVVLCILFPRRPSSAPQASEATEQDSDRLHEAKEAPAHGQESTAGPASPQSEVRHNGFDP